jgi:hypothetical protein
MNRESVEGTEGEKEREKERKILDPERLCRIL